MTYDEYKNKKDKKKSSGFLIKSLNKLFTVVIFTMLVIILSNYSPKFKNFIINEVLNSTFDFSKINKLTNNVTSVFKPENDSVPVSSEIKSQEKYMDGVKYKVNNGEKIFLKDSGIVTFIGKKDGYNNTVIIQQSNGRYAWYGNIKESVKLYDYVERGSEIGTSLSDEYYYVLIDENKN